MWTACSSMWQKRGVDVERLRRIQDLPGPRGLPLLGNLLQVERASLHLAAERWSRQYGDYFTFRMGPRRIAQALISR